MRDIFHGLFVELPVSLAAHIPWAILLAILAIFILYKFSGIFN